MLSIRPFRDEDAADTAAFMIHWRSLPSSPTPSDILRQVRHCRERVSGEMFLALDTDEDGRERTVGYLQVCEVSLVCFEPSGEIAAILVHEELRGRGIGRALVERARSWTREQGLSRLVVSSQRHREAAHRFYEREGFVRWKESSFFELMLP